MQKLENIVFRGYTKKENGHHVAVCIDLNIVAQGNTAEAAIKECSELIVQYVQYICDEYPDRFKEFVPRLAPKELVDEFNEIMRISLSAKAKTRKLRSGFAIHNFDLQPDNFCAATA